MRANAHVDDLLGRAEHEQRCAFGADRNEQRMLRRRAHEIAEPSPGLFLRREYLAGLDMRKLTMHVARAMQLQDPRLVFAGTTAAVAHGWPVPQRVLDGSVQLFSARLSRHDGPRQYLCLPPGTAVTQADGLRVTDGARTLVDCGMRLPFADALPLFDAADPQSLDGALDLCATLRRPCRPVLKLMLYADPLSENGGESFARAVMIELGFQRPVLQAWFTDPLTGKRYRVDFLWVLPDGTVIVAELDGMGKYFEPSMTQGATMEQQVAAQCERDDALKRCGVQKIVHFTFRDAARRDPLRRRLQQAGVPTAMVRW